MSDTINRQMLRTAEAAQYLGISASTMNKLRVYGDGPTFVKLGRTVVYDTSDLNDWLHTNRRTSTSVAA